MENEAIVYRSTYWDLNEIWVPDHRILNKILISFKYEFLIYMHINNNSCSSEYELIEIHLCYNTP